MKKALSKKNLWDKTPPLLKSTLGAGLGLLPLPWLLGKRFRSICRFVHDAQWWQAERVHQYQLDKLREILTLAYKKTTYYHQVFDSIGFSPQDFQTLDDMNKLPIIDKQVIIDNLSDMCTKSVTSGNIDYGSTGGTSGTPLHFYINANRSATEYAYLTTSWQRAGFKLGEPMAVLRGQTVEPDRNGLRHEYDPILRHHYYSNFHMSDENMARYLEHIATIGPCILHAYPSSAQTLAKYIIGNAQQYPINIKGILLESENVYPDQVSIIEKAFKSKTFSCYGHSEKLVMACQCEHTDNYHVWPTYGYFELLDDDGVPITTPGKRGEIVGTGFINTVVPFIRYRTGDYAKYVADHCHACGRQHTIISDLKGRWPQGELIATDGSAISMTTLNVHDDTFKNVLEYQFHQPTPGKATLCVIPITNLNETEQKLIIDNINKRLQGQIMLDLEIRTKLFKTARGKQPRVVQKFTSSS